MTMKRPTALSTAVTPTAETAEMTATCGEVVALSSHCEAPGEVPRAHGLQAVAAAVSLYVPASQAVQAVDDDSLLKVPGEQAAHTDDAEPL